MNSSNISHDVIPNFMAFDGSHAYTAYMAEAKLLFGAEVRRLREQAKLNQDQLGERIGVTRETISQLENGKTKQPGQSILMGLERVLGLPRYRSYALLAGDPMIADPDVFAHLLQIAALPDLVQRRAAWDRLPSPIRKAMLQFVQDELLDIALRTPADTLETDQG